MDLRHCFWSEARMFQKILWPRPAQKHMFWSPDLNVGRFKMSLDCQTCLNLVGIWSTRTSRGYIRYISRLLIETIFEVFPYFWRTISVNYRSGSLFFGQQRRDTHQCKDSVTLTFPSALLRIFFVLESGRPDSWKIRSTLSLGPNNLKSGPKTKIYLKKLKFWTLNISKFQNLKTRKF